MDFPSIVNSYIETRGGGFDDEYEIDLFDEYNDEEVEGGGNWFTDTFWTNQPMIEAQKIEENKNDSTDNYNDIVNSTKDPLTKELINLISHDIKEDEKEGYEIFITTNSNLNHSEFLDKIIDLMTGTDGPLQSREEIIEKLIKPIIDKPMSNDLKDFLNSLRKNQLNVEVSELGPSVFSQELALAKPKNELASIENKTQYTSPFITNENAGINVTELNLPDINKSSITIKTNKKDKEKINELGKLNKKMYNDMSNNNTQFHQMIVSHNKKTEEVGKKIDSQIAALNSMLDSIPSRSVIVDSNTSRIENNNNDGIVSFVGEGISSERIGGSYYYDNRVLANTIRNL